MGWDGCGWPWLAVNGLGGMLMAWDGCGWPGGGVHGLGLVYRAWVGVDSLENSETF